MNTLPVHLPYLNNAVFPYYIGRDFLSLLRFLPVSERANRGVMLGALVGFSGKELQIPKGSPTTPSDKHFPHLDPAQNYTARAAIFDSITVPILDTH